ncbi:invasion associated locus B family protein [Methylocapsa polymorpha]|uniref:Invasion associated locus B family protein n=1 Tax=Methylocapsa polymorpha TaxID=3080828 RepID=A0ABZ0HLU5_9HYPH|nr:invasion associated locus B family protein [Methylocapsa sp. RX1]
MVLRFPFDCAAGFAIALAALFAAGASCAAPSDSSTPNSGAASKDAKSHRQVEAKADPKKADPKKSDAKSDAKGADAKKGGKPVQVGNYGDWGAFVAQGQAGGKDKTCYALASPKERAPGALKRDPAYVFISNRPGENVRSEVSIIMGFAVKEAGDARAEIGGSNYDLVAKGNNAWIKNPAEESQFIEALKKGSKLIVKAPSLKGNVTTDTYSLSGLSQALEKVQKECP